MMRLNRSLMNALFGVLVLALPGSGESSEPKKKSTTNKPAAAKAVKGSPESRQPGLPEGAVLIGPGLYRWVSPEGKRYLYKQTPFGYMGGEEPADFGKPVEAPAGMTAVEEGDSIRFTNPTPFGTARWVRKKSELTDVEQAAWAREQAKKEAPKPAPSTPAEKK